MGDKRPPERIGESHKGRTRRAHHKAKTGCKACKSRRRKCDERQPVCSGCIRHSTDCSYAQYGGSVETQLRTTRSSPSSASPADTSRLTTTPRNALIVPPQDLNFEDLELLHQYLTSTCIVTSQRPEVTVQIQRNVPQLAQEHPFFMRGILAKAAVHLSWLRPARQQHYALLAARHHGCALPEFRSALQGLNEQNYSAVIGYSFTLVWCAFAKHTMSSTDETISRDLKRDSWLPEWFILLRGSCLVVASCRVWTKSGTHVLPEVDSLLEFSQSLEDRRLTELTTRLLPLSSQSSMCGHILSSLRHAFALASARHQNTPLRNAINFWVGTLPSEFLSLVHSEEPWTLVVMAHICILVHRSETQWFMKGHAAQFLQTIVERLDYSWQKHIHWPCEEVGISLVEIPSS